MTLCVERIILWFPSSSYLRVVLCWVIVIFYRVEIPSVLKIGKSGTMTQLKNELNQKSGQISIQIIEGGLSPAVDVYSLMVMS